jgi:hypothetical protein
MCAIVGAQSISLDQQSVLVLRLGMMVHACVLNIIQLTGICC